MVVKGMRQKHFIVTWLLLALPLAWLTYDYLFGETYYGGYVHLTGRIAAWLMLLALAVTPLRLTVPGAGWTRWLMTQRRYIGVAAFAYAAAHLAAYLARQDWDRIVEDAGTMGMIAGWIAFALFAALAATSNDRSVRRLRAAWKTLHRLIHIAAILVFVHWALTAFDPFLAYCHIAGLALIEVWRLVLSRRHRPVTGRE
jgi:sulfoxide reductase heme-binding subunit YedZ